MADFNLPQFFNKFVNQAAVNLRGNTTEGSPKIQNNKTQNAQKSQVPNFQKNLTTNQNKTILVNTFQAQQRMPIQQFRMNHMASIDRSIYIKDLLNLPKDMNELVRVLQQNLPQMQAQMQGKQLPQGLAMLDLSSISMLLQQNSKEAVNKLILAMSNAAKQGITDMTQIKETMKLINASVAAAGEQTSSSTLKALMLLYLPWLPLQEGVGFDLEIEAKEGGQEGESVLTIMISTRNFGNIQATLTLTTPNSVDIVINCSDKFPKEELLKRLKGESANCAAQTSVAFMVQKPKAESTESKSEAKINMSSTNEINPYLLLMSHAVIRHTIEIDNEVTMN